LIELNKKLTEDEKKELIEMISNDEIKN